ncbi:MAG: amidohydrolase family protein [Dehalococcoidia bacterium]
MSDQPYGVIDTVCTLNVPDEDGQYQVWSGLGADKLRMSDEMLRGPSPEQLVEQMDAAGVARALLLAPRAGPHQNVSSTRSTYEGVARLVERYPDRFLARAGFDPTEGREGLRRLREAVRDMGYVGAHLYPHWFGWPPDDRRYYPFYATCAELDIPVQMQVGQTLLYLPGVYLQSLGRPITLDTVACDFPEIRIIGIHTGQPWMEEMISVAWKHPNVYIGADTWLPRSWKQELVHFINSWGQDKVIFGTGYPLVEPGKALQQINAHGLRPEAKRKLLHDNAVRVFKL